MSTDPRTLDPGTTDASTPTDRTRPTLAETDAASTEASSAPTEPTTTAPRSTTRHRDDATSWTDRCQRAFARDATARLRNLVDRENQAMPTCE